MIDRFETKPHVNYTYKLHTQVPTILTRCQGMHSSNPRMHAPFYPQALHVSLTILHTHTHKMPFYFASELDIARWYDFINYERIILDCLFYYNHRIYFKIQTGFLNLTFMHVPLLSLSKIRQNTNEMYSRVVAKTISVT